jgi:hypothetical protein
LKLHVCCTVNCRLCDCRIIIVAVLIKLIVKIEPAFMNKLLIFSLHKSLCSEPERYSGHCVHLLKSVGTHTGVPY